MHIWRRSKLYRFVVIGGLLACVAVPIYLSLGPYADDPGSKVPAYGAVVAVGIYIFLVMGMQIASLGSRKQHGQAAELFVEPEQRAVGSADPPLGWSALSQSMALHGGDPTGEHLAQDRLSRGMASQLKLGVVLMVCVIGAMFAWLSGAPAWVFAPALLVVVVLGARVPAMMSVAQSSADAYLRPLGLHTIQMPRSQTGIDSLGRPRHTVTGPTVFGGERDGRPVRIELNSRGYRTRIDGKYERFEVESENGRLTSATGGPVGLSEFVDSLTPDPRWRNVSATCKGQGITVERKKLKNADHAFGLWLDDLWLAEQLAERVG